MAKGHTIEKSVREASIFTKKAIEKGDHGTLNQYWAFKTH